MATKRQPEGSIYQGDTLPPGPLPPPPKLSPLVSAVLGALLMGAVALGSWLGLRDPCAPCEECPPPASTTLPGNTPPAGP